MNVREAILVKEAGKFALKFDEYTVYLPESKNKNGCLEPYAGKEVYFGIRPEHVHDEAEFLDKYKAEGGNGIVKANVDVTELMGAEIYLYVNIGGIPITARVEPTSTAKPGDTIEIAFELEKLHLFDKETEMTITN